MDIHTQLRPYLSKQKIVYRHKRVVPLAWLSRSSPSYMCNALG